MNSNEGTYTDTHSQPSVSVQRRGLTASLIACLFSALMGATFFAAHRKDPNFSSLSGSFVRVLVNFLFILLSFSRPFPSLFHSPLRHKSLWLWGVFGALTVTTYFAAVAAIGNGRAAFLGASSGVFIAALSPLIARQKVAPLNWVAVVGSIFGLYLMRGRGVADGSYLGTGLAITSGLFSALAYLMIARTRVFYSSSAVIMTWCIAALLTHLLIFSVYSVSWPTDPTVWLILLISGIAASLAQFFTTYAFQRVPASRVATLSYLAPVLSLFFDVLFFGLSPTPTSTAGAAIILAFGLAVPTFTKSP